MEDDIEKQEGQIWVAFFLKSEKNIQLMKEPEIRDTFDLFEYYKKDELQMKHLLVRLCQKIDKL